MKLLSLLLLPLFLGAQEAQPHFVTGIEAGFDARSFHPYSKDGTSYTLGVSVEKPIGQWSVGSGLLLKRFGQQETYAYRETREGQTPSDLPITHYIYEQYQYELSYLSIPLRVQYRLPCNCVYLQAGVHADMRTNEGGPNYPSGSTITTRHEPSNFNIGGDGSLRPFNYTFEFAVGFKMHLTPDWRLFFRPTYRITQQPAKLASPPTRTAFRQLNLALGVQRAFF